MNYIQAIEAEQMRNDLPDFHIGDTIRVHAKIKEGNRERIQLYEGILIARRGAGSNQSITVRRISNGIGVERVFLLHSPRVAKIEIVRKGKVRRAKLYYLRSKLGKAGRVKEKLS